MALSSSVLSDLIKTAISGSFTVDDATELQKLTDAIAQSVVDHIVASAVVTSDGATGTGTPGGPLPIVALPGTIS